MYQKNYEKDITLLETRTKSQDVMYFKYKCHSSYKSGGEGLPL